MWNLIKIEIKNLFAHKDSFYEFKNNACTVIFGKNSTDKGMENNGAGKTTLFEAICIALTNESLRAIKKDSFINRDGEDCKITLYLFNPVMKLKLKIVRQFFRSNKPAKIEIWENDTLNTQIVSVNDANKRVLELIGISRDDLLRYYIISQDNHYTFFTASDSDKKEIMNRITSADMINPILEELDSRFKRLDSERKRLDSEVGKLSSRVELLEEQREEVLYNDNTEEEVKDLERKLLNTEEELKDLDLNVIKWNKSVELRKNQIESITVEDVSELKIERDELKKSIEEIEDEIDSTKLARKKIQSELDGTTVCPNCEHEFINESELDLTVEEAKEALMEAKEALNNFEKKLIIKKKKYDKIKKRIFDAKNAEELVGDVEAEKRTYEKKIKRAVSERIELIAKISKVNEDIRELNNRKIDDKVIKNIDKRIKETESEIRKLNAEINPIVSEIEVVKYWQFNMGRSGFMTYLANKSIKIIEGITNSYLRKFGVDISVLINGFKVLKSGDVREKIDIFVLNDGVTAEQFLSKSGGERGRVMLAGILGIQHLINLSTNGKGLNLLILDECFHGMDARGQENIIKIFEKMGITILMITQNVNESFNNENTLYVVKENGISKYVNSQS